MRLPSRAAESFSIAQHAPLDARRVGTAHVEPRLGTVRGSFGPRLGGGDRAIDECGELVIERRAVGIQLNAPPESGRGEHVARFARSRAAGFPKLGLNLVEAGVKDEVVGADETVHPAQLRRSGR